MQRGEWSLPRMKHGLADVQPSPPSLHLDVMSTQQRRTIIGSPHRHLSDLNAQAPGVSSAATCAKGLVRSPGGIRCVTRQDGLGCEAPHQRATIYELAWINRLGEEHMENFELRRCCWFFVMLIPRGERPIGCKVLTWIPETNTQAHGSHLIVRNVVVSSVLRGP